MLIRILRLPLELILTVLVLVDEIARPIYRPLIRWVASRQLTHAFERWVAARQRFTILALLAVPFAIVEPLKLIALIWIGKGLVATGVVTLGLAHLVSFVVIERIYSAGRDKLLTFGWLAYVMGLVTAVRDWLLTWVRSSPLWRAAADLRAEILAAFRARRR